MAEYYSTKEKSERNPEICNNVDESGGHEADEVSQTEDDKYYMIDLVETTCKAHINIGTLSNPIVLQRKLGSNKLCALFS